ncbi:MAG: Lrp/AsnC family transcriptional regulator, partial [Candidatus Korarchaeota archaeon]|nr:Lrp/AsnC family transcriptional regulator [Candidatus Korarchaeota archaeon]
EIGTEQNLFEQLQSIPEIKTGMITYGEYDIVVEAETEDTEKMDQLITSKIRRLGKVRSTITLRVTG